MTTPLRVRFSTKQYILAALMGMLAMVAVIAAISISLAPAHIAFSVQDANITYANTAYQDGGKLVNGSFWYYNLTLVTNNPSRRTAVSYGSLTVNIWWSETAWIPTDEVNTSAALPGWLPPGNTTVVKLGVEGAHYDKAKTSPQGSSNNVTVDNGGGGGGGDVANWPNCRVVVEARVWFRFAGVPTLPYTVKVSCFPVNFLGRGTRGPVNCTG